MDEDIPDWLHHVHVFTVSGSASAILAWGSGYQQAEQEAEKLTPQVPGRIYHEGNLYDLLRDLERAMGDAILVE
jgi:hypothetical protein